MAAVKTSGALKAARRDVRWADTKVAAVFGPFDMPSVDRIRDAVAALAANYPQSRLTWRLDRDAGVWVDDRSPESIVVEREWPAGAAPGDVLGDLLGDTSLPEPLALVAFPYGLGIRICHALGDGRFVLTVVSAVLRTALTGQITDWPVVPGGRLPLARAVARTFARRPLLARAAVKDRFVAAAGDDSPRPPVSWSPASKTIHAALDRATADEFLEWGRLRWPQSSKFALQITLVLRALERMGLAIDDDVRVLVDLRRYLGWDYIDGNFVAGVPVRLSADLDPGQVSTVLRTATGSGRPLLNHVLASTRGTAPSPTSYAPGARVRLAFTNLGRVPEIELLPFANDRPPVYAGCVTPDGPRGVTVMVGENPQVLSINVTFHANAVDERLLQAALGLVVADPIQLCSGDGPKDALSTKQIDVKVD